MLSQIDFMGVPKARTFSGGPGHVFVLIAFAKTAWFCFTLFHFLGLMGGAWHSDPSLLGTLVSGPNM